MPLDISPDEREVLVKGADYRALRDSPGWKRLVKFMEWYLNEALVRMRQSQSNDPTILSHFVIRWDEREAMAEAIQAEIVSAISQREHWLEVMKPPNVSEEEILDARSTTSNT